MPYRCLSVTQPWAWAIVAGFKCAENRTWRPAYRGLLLIHASSTTRDFTQENEQFCYRAGGQPLIDACNDESNLDSFALDHFGAIIGAAELYDVLPVADVPPEHKAWASGPYCLMMRNAVEFSTPIACKGALNVWNLPASLGSAVEDQLAIARAKRRKEGELTGAKR